MVTKCAGKLSSSIERIIARIITFPIVHFDETGIKMDGKTRWVHNASNNHYTYLTVEDKRGHEGITSSGILSNFKGIAVHDCWAS